MTTIVLTTASSSPWTVPSDWNNSSNSIACIGAASSGAGTAIHGGGAAGVFRINQFTLTPGGSVTFVVGVGGASVSTGAGNVGGDTCFGGTSLGSCIVGAQGGQALGYGWGRCPGGGRR